MMNLATSDLINVCISCPETLRKIIDWIILSFLFLLLFSFWTGSLIILARLNIINNYYRVSGKDNIVHAWLVGGWIAGRQHFLKKGRKVTLPLHMLLSEHMFSIITTRIKIPKIHCHVIIRGPSLSLSGFLMVVNFHFFLFDYLAGSKTDDPDIRIWQMFE